MEKGMPKLAGRALGSSLSPLVLPSAGAAACWPPAPVEKGSFSVWACSVQSRKPPKWQTQANTFEDAIKCEHSGFSSDEMQDR